MHMDRRRAAMEAGASAFLVKPVDREEMRRVLQDFLDTGGKSPLFEELEPVADWLQQGISRLNYVYDGLDLTPSDETPPADMLAVMAGALVKVEHMGDHVLAAVFTDWNSGDRLARILFGFKDRDEVTKQHVGDALAETLSLGLATVAAEGEASMEDDGDREADIRLSPPQVLFGAHCVKLLEDAEDKLYCWMKGSKLNLKVALLPAQHVPVLEELGK